MERNPHPKRPGVKPLDETEESQSHTSTIHSKARREQLEPTRDWTEAMADQGPFRSVAKTNGAQPEGEEGKEQHPAKGRES